MFLIKKIISLTINCMYLNKSLFSGNSVITFLSSASKERTNIKRNAPKISLRECFCDEEIRHGDERDTRISIKSIFNRCGS